VHKRRQADRYATNEDQRGKDLSRSELITEGARGDSQEQGGTERDDVRVGDLGWRELEIFLDGDG
jgi:hypothetical protein